jgi:hypothetical protein
MKDSDLRVRAAIVTILISAAAFPAAQQKTLFSLHSNA